MNRHISCEEYSNTVNEYTESSSNEDSEKQKFTYDPIYSNQVKCAENLLNTFQETFNVDFNKKERLSEQLKIEKEVFPQCIQAERKYYNKRKTMSMKGRPSSRSFIIPGETISSLKSSNNTKKRVNKWLDDQENINEKPKRYAFTNLDVNSPRKNVTKSFKETKTYSKHSPNSNKIIDNIKTVHQRHDNKYSNNSFKKMKPPVFIQYDSAIFSDDEAAIIEDSQSISFHNQSPLSKSSNTGKLNIQNNRDLKCTESEVIVIDDTESKLIDKDQEALLAVVAADEDLNKIRSPIDFDHLDITKANESQLAKVKSVPFVKKYDLPISPFKKDDVSKCEKLLITIKSDDYIIRIKEIVNNDANKGANQQSRGVQTETNETVSKQFNEANPEDFFFQKVNESAECNNSEDIFQTDQNMNKKQNIDIEQNLRKENDIHSNSNSNVFTVVADVHVPCSKNISPSPLKELKVVVAKPRIKRFIASSDSSEKENKDPNTRRGINKKKKKVLKKKRKN